MSWTKASDDAELAELDALARQHVGLIHQLRIEQLDRTLHETGPLAVRHSHAGFCGDRLTAWLDDGSVLTLKLLRPNRAALSAVCAMRWDPKVGWLLVGRTTTGERSLFYAWKARLFR